MKLSRFRDFVFEQIEKIQQFSGIGTPVMLILTFTFTAFTYIEHRNVHPYLGIPLIFLGIFLVYWSIAHTVVRKGGTYISRSRAAIKYNQFSVWEIPPFQWMMMRYIWIPVLERTANTDDEKKELGMVLRWMDLGFIPKDDFPDKLKHFYMADNEVDKK